MPDLQPRFNSVVREIERAYGSLGHRVGWRFLLSPRRTFVPGARIALLSFHPGGDADLYPEQPRESCEHGSAYLTESWHGCPPGESPLQMQVRALLRLFDAAPDDTLCAYFVPFRAPEWNEMVAPSESLHFARRLWGALMPDLSPKVLLVVGAVAFDELAREIGPAAHTYERSAEYGTQKLALAQFGEMLVARIPTLTRFKLFSRSKSRAAMEDLARRVELFRQGSDAWRG